MTRFEPSNCSIWMLSFARYSLSSTVGNFLSRPNDFKRRSRETALSRKIVTRSAWFDSAARTLINSTGAGVTMTVLNLTFACPSILPIKSLYSPLTVSMICASIVASMSVLLNSDVKRTVALPSWIVTRSFASDPNDVDNFKTISSAFLSTSPVALFLRANVTSVLSAPFATIVEAFGDTSSIQISSTLCVMKLSEPRSFATPPTMIPFASTE